MIELSISALLVLLTTAGQILLKKSAIYTHEQAKSMTYLFIGYLLLIITVGFSYQLMKLVPMKYFTIIMSLNYITVLFASIVFLKEKLNNSKIFGTILVAIGIAIFMWSADANIS